MDARDVSARAVVDDLDDASLARRLEDAKEEETTTRELEFELGTSTRAAEDAALEKIVLDFSPEYDFTRKMLDVGAYFERSPGELAVRAAEVLAVVGSVYATWTYEERLGTPREKVGNHPPTPPRQDNEHYWKLFKPSN